MTNSPKKYEEKVHEKSQTQYDFAVIGAWHLSSVQSACLAEIGHRVVLVNPDSENRWSSFPTPPVSEPGLSEMISAGLKENRLEFSNGFDPLSWKAKIVWLAMDTPVDDHDQIDLAPLLQVADQIKSTSPGAKLVVTSQVPVGFCRRLVEEFGFEVAYIPENLRLGKGIETFLNADRTVIGCDQKRFSDELKVLLAKMKTQFFECDLPTAEMIKHATNAFLATSISFANQLAQIGEKVGADNLKVAQALKLDARIGKSAYVVPGLGFAGGTLPRDLRILQKTGKSFGLATPLIDSVLKINETTAQAMAETVTSYLTRVLGSPKGAKVLIVGYTYKPDIDTLRRSYSVEVAKTLSQLGCELAGFDPRLNDKNIQDISGYLKHLPTFDDVEKFGNSKHPALETRDGYSAVLIMTPRPEFADLPWKNILESDESESLFFDIHNFFQGKKIAGLGFTYKAFWQREIKSG